MTDNSDKAPVPGWVEARISAVSHWTDNLFSLRLAASLPGFEAGQYTWLALPDNSPEPVNAQLLEAIAQPYSILSTPSASELEFFFYTQVEGDVSRRLSRLKVGDNLWLKQQAEGTLTLSRASSASTLCLLATGTGVAPFVSMLGTAEIWQRFERVILVYAVRQWQDLRYREVFARLRSRYPQRFKLIPFVSREPVPDSEPDAIHGHIPASLANGELEQKAGLVLTPHNCQIMLCGNPGMVKDAIAVLHERGFRDNKPSGSGQLNYEAYW